MPFFDFGHNTFSFSEGTWAWVENIIDGLVALPDCSVCGARREVPDGELLVAVSSGGLWPDCLGCGRYPLLVLSKLSVDYLQKAGIAVPVGGRIVVERVSLVEQAARDDGYVWIDGSQAVGAMLDFEESGFVDARTCNACGTVSYDVSATYDVQSSRSCSRRFVSGSWSGRHLFTTDLSANYFFATDEVLDVAKSKKLTNMKFVPIEQGRSSTPLDYS